MLEELFEQIWVCFCKGQNWNIDRQGLPTFLEGF